MANTLGGMSMDEIWAIWAKVSLDEARRRMEESEVIKDEATGLRFRVFRKNGKILYCDCLDAYPAVAVGSPAEDFVKRLLTAENAKNAKAGK